MSNDFKLTDFWSMAKQGTGDLLITTTTLTGGVARNIRGYVEEAEFRIALNLRELKAERPVLVAQTEAVEAVKTREAEYTRKGTALVMNSTRRQAEEYRDLLMSKYGQWAVDDAVDAGQLPESMRSSGSAATASTADNTNPFASLSEEEDANNGRKVN